MASPGWELTQRGLGVTLRVAQLSDGRKALIIRTSDRISFKKCRRSWSWSSHLKRNLGPANLASPLWFGSAVHYALEDFHGYKQFENAQDAFRAYCIATSKQHQRDLPDDAPQLFDMGSKMLDYYENFWLAERKEDVTYWEPDPHTGELVPQVEVNFEIEVPLKDNPYLETLMHEHGADCILYRGTIDRVAIDEHGRLWVVEYKTAKIAEHMHYQTDPQVTTYVWAATHMYPDKEIAGVVYHQFIKKTPELPRLLSTGKVSTASNLVSSAPLYRKALVNMYGKEGLAPEENRKKLLQFMMEEDEHNDRYIQRQLIERSTTMVNAEAEKILLEMEDILNPDLALYPNPTRDCSRMCSFLNPCVGFDNGDDYETMLAGRFVERDGMGDWYWRKRMPNPSALAEMRRQALVPDLFDVQIRIQGLSPEEQEAIERGEEEVAFTFNMS
jgi:hypothetical protein